MTNCLRVWVCLELDKLGIGRRKQVSFDNLIILSPTTFLAGPSLDTNQDVNLI